MLSLLLCSISDAHINNSGSHLNKIIRINMTNKFLASLDIRSLNTNIPVDKCVELLDNQLRKTNTILPLSVSKLIKICTLCTSHCYFQHSSYFHKRGGCPRGVMVKTMDCGIVVCEFVLQSRYYVHFRANTLGKGMNPPYPPSYGLNSTTTVLRE